ncbi:MAG: TetR/AcrR family transcriptional regulator [Oscillospiraceae bacterium]|nr:TetR/AcrR family transcriptional regulator [Oscillospiraceae bacterium]
MPPRTKATKEEITGAAVALVRQEGPGALNARALARRLGTSTQPIFSNFASMEALNAEVLAYAENLYQQFFREELAREKYPPYKASGMAYIRFARQERELFKLQFMRDRRGQDTSGRGSAAYEPIMEMIRKNTGLDTRNAELLHLEMWAGVHGIAAMVATDYMDLSDELVSELLTDLYQGLLHRFTGKGACK